MYEERQGPVYDVYSNITEDLYTWKEYSHSSVRLNQHHLLELNIPLSDVTF